MAKKYIPDKIKNYKQKDILMNTYKSFDLTNKKALVTGAGQGIGKGYALALAEAGADVIVVDLNEKTGEETANEIIKLGKNSIFLQADVTKSIEVKKIFKTITKLWNKLDIAVNNAGGGHFQDAIKYSEDEWNEQLQLNLTSVLLCCQEEAKIMLKQKKGSIINTASISGSIVNRATYHAAYNTSKAGIIHLTKCLGVEWAQKGIRVNSISPGNILTPAAYKPEVIPWHKKWADMNPMGRLGEIDDLKGPVIFLASEASNFITGHNLLVDGGYTLW